jgi:hypothetical protein
VPLRRVRLPDVLGQLATAAELRATVFGDMDQATWARRLVCNWPSPDVT